jgi:tetratricopeptide (TPR) repeat protein
MVFKLKSQFWARVSRLLVALLVVFLVLGRSQVAWADPEEDAKLFETMDLLITGDLKAGAFGKAEPQASAILAKCIRTSCAPATKARAMLLLGTIQAQLKKTSLAKTSMQNAQKADPTVELPEYEMPTAAKTLWDAIHVAGAPDEGKPPQASPQDIEQAQKLLAEAVAAFNEGRYDDCVDKDRAAVKLDNQPKIKLHLVLCLYRANKLKEALKEASSAFELAKTLGDVEVQKMAEKRVEDLIKRFPKIKFVLPEEEYEDFKIIFDEKEVPKEALGRTPNIDPGPHIVEARGKKGGKSLVFRDDRVFAREAQIVTVKIEMKPESILSRDQIDCLKNAHTPDEEKKCKPAEDRNIVIKASTDVNGYMDTTAVRVFSPGINAAVFSPTSGWNVGGNYLIDIVSAASPDIISYASPPFREIRHAGSLYGGYKPGPWGLQLSGNLSVEPDYISRTIGLAGTYDLNEKLTTPRVAISYTWDKIGRKPFSDCTDLDTTFKNNLGEEQNTAEGACVRPFRTWTLEAGVTQIASPTMLFQIGATAQFERGDQSKPYRYVPMFINKNADKIVAGDSVKKVNELRESYRPREQLPTERDRYAIAGRIIKRIGTNMTLRAEERLYIDTWGTFASTTDIRYLIDVSNRVRLWPHVRFHLQTAATFYQLAYRVPIKANGDVDVPLFRTGDRELSSMLGETLGLGAHLGLGNLDGETKAGLTFAFDAMFNQYSQSLFISGRTALYSSMSFDVEF